MEAAGYEVIGSGPTTVQVKGQIERELVLSLAQYGLTGWTDQIDKTL